MAQNRLTAVGRVLPIRSQDLVEVTFQVTGGFSFGILHAQRDAHGRGHADGGRAAHHHGANDVGNLLVRLADDVGFLRGQLRLVDEADALVGPF